MAQSPTHSDPSSLRPIAPVQQFRGSPMGQLGSTNLSLHSPESISDHHMASSLTLTTGCGSPPPAARGILSSGRHMVLGGAYAPCIGIDLGTTNSCVAVWTGSSACVLRSFQYSSTLIPSMVGYQEDRETGEIRQLVGHPAYRQWARNPTGTIYSSKRWIGRPHDAEQAAEYPYKVVRGPHGQCAFDIPGREELLTPEEVGAAVLAHLKDIACTEHFRGEVRDAVITVPAYFNDAQRAATKRAGVMAGLNVLTVLNEPTAAALACGLHDVKQRKDTNLWMQKNMLVFDLGGGTFDVTVMAVNKTDFRVLATGGDALLGGDDIDRLLLKYFCTDMAKKCPECPRDESGERVRLSQAEQVRFLQRCREVKEALAASTQQQFEVEVGGQTYTASVSLAKLNNLCRTLFQRMMKIVDDVLTQSGLQRAEIDDVVLVGGATRMAKVEQELKKFFKGCKAFLVKTANPDEVVAEGAVIKAASLCEDAPSSSHKPVLPLISDVIPQTVGIALAGDQYSQVIRRNTPIPPGERLDCFCMYQTVAEEQTSIEFHVFQGEEPRASANFYLGTCRIDGIPTGRQRGNHDICVQFSFDQMGILSIYAWVQGAGHLQTHMEITDAVYSQQTAAGYLPNFTTAELPTQTPADSPFVGYPGGNALFLDSVPQDDEDRRLDQLRMEQERLRKEREREERRRQRELEKREKERLQQAAAAAVSAARRPSQA
eukprot:TRINITY_DN50276_c0_g1_i1.p1 TRINITY_DN50276_c0_g1~~TRINITY_DN50276_c0_g1_i1.p1  ORF type:complete len:748 (+),score=222.89 TRINITY_DN50276_c0_g1_i1:105-2246(+)